MVRNIGAIMKHLGVPATDDTDDTEETGES
jgi:hypothetical protein